MEPYDEVEVAQLGITQRPRLVPSHSHRICVAECHARKMDAKVRKLEEDKKQKTQQ